MAQQGLRTAGEDGRKVAGMGGQREMSHRVDAAMEAGEEAGFDAPLDAVLGQAKSQQLGDRDDSMLPSRQAADRPVDGVWLP